MHCLRGALLALTLSGAASGETALLDFYADWCGPCRQMHPVVERLAAAGYPVRQVNVDHDPALAAQYRVGPIPCFVMVADGRVVDREIGVTSYERLAQMCNAGLAAGSRRQASPGFSAASPSGAAPATTAVTPGSPPLSTASLPGNGASAPQADPAGSGSWAPGRRSAAEGSGAAGPVNDARLVAATVRLCIRDADGQSCGSGTIIDARDGEALILTCGHLFRDSQGKGPIEVDLFGPAPAESIPGRLLAHDMDRDLGLVAIRTPGPVSVVRVAPPAYRIHQLDRVINVGCNNGEPPTVRRSRVTAMDKYLGPANVEVGGLPVQGRSGGGLFSEDGYLIGVCNAADPADNEGLYAALESIHAQLEEANLAFVCGEENDSPAAALAVADPPPMAKQMPRPGGPAPPRDAATAPAAEALAANPTTDAEPLGREEQAALDEIRRRKVEGAEVICVIRSHSDPEAPSEILVLDRASDAFLRQLAAEATGSDRRRLTSLEIPNRRQAPRAVSLRATGSRAGAGTALHPSSRSLPARPAARPDWQPRWLDSQLAAQPGPSQ